jgi:hypothetical protein
MTRVRFEPTIPVFERAKTFHALDITATAPHPPHITTHNHTLQSQTYAAAAVCIQ